MMYIQSRKCIDMFMAGLSPSMRQTLHKHVYTLYMHVYAIWSGFQMYKCTARCGIWQYTVTVVQVGTPQALSVLKSHFNPDCIGDCKQLLSKSEKRFVHTHWVQEGLGLSEALCVRTFLFVGKCGFRFRRFKKGSRALATRTKQHCLD